MIGHLNQNIKIRTKIILVYISVLILSIGLSFAVLAMINERRLVQEVGSYASQTVGAVQGNLSYIFDNVTQFSELIYFDKNVQDALSNVKTENIDPKIQQTIQKSLINMLLSGEYVASVFVFDKFNNYYHNYKTGPILVHKERIPETEWYQEMKKIRGDVLYIHKSEGVLSFPTVEDQNYISLVREIFRLDNYESLATLMINVHEETLQQYFNQLGDAYDSQYSIVDRGGNYIVRPTNERLVLEEEYLRETFDEAYQVYQNEHHKWIVVKKDLGIADWSLIGVFPISTDTNIFRSSVSSFIILIVTANLIFIFICSIVLTKLIFNPLNKMQIHMSYVMAGELIEMEVPENPNEINHLKKVFNQMIQAIRNLIEQVKHEEQVIAKNELNILQAQINPHFLYNTLDAVSALALLKDNERCFQMTQALGKFYRNSLNSGSDLIAIRDEIDCIENYITILNIRYENKIFVQFDIEEEIMDYRILKLILQPIVENAIHHGMRNKTGNGLISIKGYRDEAEIIFIVADDGVGMSEERIQEVLSGRSHGDKSGFGLYSAILRLSLYYGINKPMNIISEIDSGTEVIIRVKIQGEDIVHD